MQKETEGISRRWTVVAFLSYFFYSLTGVFSETLKKMLSAIQELKQKQKNLLMSSLSSKCTELDVFIYSGSR